MGLTTLNRYQLIQLKRLDPDAYRAAMVGVRSGFVALANGVIVEAMRAALTRLSRNGQSSPEANGNGACYNNDTPVAHISPLPGEVLYDLVISSRKYGYGSTTHAEAPILWWKVAGQAKAAPSYRVSLVDVVDRLGKYELIDTEVHRDQVVRKYRKIGEEKNGKSK